MKNEVHRVTGVVLVPVVTDHVTMANFPVVLLGSERAPQSCNHHIRVLAAVPQLHDGYTVTQLDVNLLGNGELWRLGTEDEVSKAKEVYPDLASEIESAMALPTKNWYWKSEKEAKAEVKALFTSTSLDEKAVALAEYRRYKGKGWLSFHDDPTNWEAYIYAYTPEFKPKAVDPANTADF